MDGAVERKEGIMVILPEIVVIDLDRTLCDVENVMRRFYSVSNGFNIDSSEVEAARHEAQARGQSFDPLGYIKHKLTPGQYGEFGERFRLQTDFPILFPDAEPFLDLLRNEGMLNFILTYGKNEEWQRLKISASGYRGDVIYLDHIVKGREIAKWKNGGFFEIETPINGRQRTGSIALIDDKAGAFGELPDGCRGFWLKRGELLESQKGDVPAGVVIINSLDELSVRRSRLVRQMAFI